MEQIELCQYFKQGVKKLDIMLYNGKATFKHCTDILKFKLMLESWINQNQSITESTYTDHLQRMLDHKNKPFTYNKAITEPSDTRRVYLADTTKNQKIADKRRKKSKNKTKQYQKSPKMIEIPKNYTKKQHLKTDYNDYTTEDDLFCNNQKLDDRQNKYSDSSSNHEDDNSVRYSKEPKIEKFKQQNDGQSTTRNKSADYNNVNDRIGVHKMTPIITKEQFDKKADTSNIETLQNSRRKSPISIERSTNKSAIYEPTRKSTRNRVSNDIYYDEFYDELGRLHYKGQVKNSLANGFGTLYFVETGNIEYTGQFKDNLLHGNGTLFDQLGNKIYYGDFLEGVRSGIGVEYYASSGLKFYEGQWKDDMWNGWGKVWNLLSEVEYEGKVVDNKPFDYHYNAQKKRNDNIIRLETDLEPIKEAKIKTKDNAKKGIKKKTKKPKKIDKENEPKEKIVIRPKSVIKTSRLNTETNRPTNNDQNSCRSNYYDMLSKNNVTYSEETKLKYSDRNSYCKSGNVSKNILERTDDCLNIEIDSKIQGNVSNFGESPNQKNTLEETPYDDFSRLTKGMPKFDSTDKKFDKTKKESFLDTTEQNISMKADIISIQNTSYDYRNKDSMAMNANLSPINNLNQTNLEETGIHEGTILESNRATETETNLDVNFLE